MTDLTEKNFVWNARLVEKKLIAKRTWEFTFSMDQSDFTFVAGQYIWIQLSSLVFEDPHGNRRAFSISSVPGTGTVQCIFRESDSGFKRSLLAMEPGEPCEIIGPFGSSFCVKDHEVEGELIMIAGGVGVAPFISLIRTLLSQASFQKKIVLITLNDSAEKVPYADELKQYAQTHTNFHYVNVVGRKFLWSDVSTFVESGCDDWNIAGPQGMVDSVYATLSAHEILKMKMHFENYFPTEQTILGQLIQRNRAFHTSQNETVSYRTLRTAFVYKYAPIFILLSAFFSFVSGVSHRLNQEPSLVIDVASVVLLFLSILWFVFKKARRSFIYLILLFVACILLIALFDPAYSHSITFWLPFFSIAAFLLLEKQGWVLSFGFLFMICLYAFLSTTGIIESKSDTVDLFQIVLSVLFTTLLAGFYELVVHKSGLAFDQQYNLSRIFEQAIQSSSNHIILTDKNGTIQFANRAAERTTGYSVQEILGNTPRLWGGLHSAQFYKQMWNKKKTGEVFVGELMNHRKSHQTYHVLAHISPIIDEQNRVMGYIGTEEDITKIKQTEAAAVKNKERFEQMANTISNVFRIISRKGNELLFVSKACEVMWQKSAESLYEDPERWMERIHIEDQQHVRKTFEQLVAEGGDYSVEYRIVRDDGTIRFIRDTGGVVASGTEKDQLIVGEARDITFEKEVDRVKTEFVSLASHQLRSPLTAIGWFSELLLNEKNGKLTKRQKEYIHEVREGNKRMIDLVNALLNTSRLDLGSFVIDPVPTDFVVLSKDVLKEMQNEIKQKKLHVNETYQKNLPSINADEKLMRMIFQNLISNAIKYTPEKGQLDVSMNVEGDAIRIMVKDTGFGIPKAQQQRIFSRLYRAENVVQKNIEGTGLGLYIVKSILDQSGGKIWFESEQDHGSTFFVELPLTGMKKKEGVKVLE